ncbi:hypothetical protein WA158_003113 [Blastocystis sp. Blastoise]
MNKFFVFVLIVALCVSAHHHGFREPRKGFSYEENFKRFAAPYSTERRGNSPAIYVVDFGADPTGMKDSSDAFQAAIDEAMKRGYGTMADEIHDCGGVSIDLEGGVYLFDKPVYFPQFHGNWKMTRGTVRASDKFPADKHIIIVGENKCGNPQGSCNEHIDFSFMTFDSNLHAAGGLQIFRTMGGNVGPNILFIGYLTSGLDLEGGHEVMVHQGWFGEYWYEGGHQNITSENGIGVLVNGNDHFLNDVIFFWSGTGVVINGGATLMRGVHSWSHNTAFIINAEATRLENCYIDYNKMIVNNFEHNVIVDTFFLYGSVILQPVGKNKNINGFIMSRSQFDGKGIDTVIVDLSKGSFGTIRDCYITETIASHTGYNVRQTQLKKSIHLENTSHFEYDFSKHLVFGHIRDVVYSVMIESGELTTHALRPIENGTKVIVEMGQPITGTVTFVVDESEYTHQY